MGFGKSWKEGSGVEGETVSGDEIAEYIRHQRELIERKDQQIDRLMEIIHEYEGLMPDARLYVRCVENANVKVKPNV